jgi:putative FmdB family regulatory protein
MPIYVFRCSGCGREREIYTRSFDTPPPHCDRCGEEMHKTINAPTVVFKSEGFTRKVKRNEQDIKRSAYKSL